MDEPWISVITLDSGEQKEISMLELFRQAECYRSLSGDMETQDFAVLRMLLAVIQTVFSRVDAEGKPYNGIILDEMMRQKSVIDSDEIDDVEVYTDSEEDTWEEIWKRGKFPKVICDYLELWRDHFFLFDTVYPFYQVTREQMDRRLPKGKKASAISGRNMNRTVSESGNKEALFSPTSSQGKDLLSEAELARWMITLQGYTGLSDKVSLFEKGIQPSKGWIFDLGGLCLAGRNLFETLMLNYIPVHSEKRFMVTVQKPCWEYDGEAVIARLIEGKPINNLAELYTNWSRAIFLNPDADMRKAISVEIAKLPAIQHIDQFLEPMTIWRFNKSGDAKGHFTPRKHQSEQAMWRSFGLITMKTSIEGGQKRPGILRQYDRVKRVAGERTLTLQAVSMKDDANATSWVPVDEITDELRLNDIVITDEGQSGWLIRINSVVDETKSVVENVYGRLLEDIAEIRSMPPDKEGAHIIASGKKALYQQIDIPFRDWLQSIRSDDSKEEKILEWKSQLRRLSVSEAQGVLKDSVGQDYRGIIKDGHAYNVVTAYLRFMGRLKKYC